MKERSHSSGSTSLLKRTQREVQLCATHQVYLDVFTQSRIYRPFYAQGVREEKWLQTVSVLNTSPLKKSNFDINVQILGEDQIKREPITFS